jgi:hypothetical protein
MWSLWGLFCLGREWMRQEYFLGAVGSSEVERGTAGVFSFAPAGADSFFA